MSELIVTWFLAPTVFRCATGYFLSAAGGSNVDCVVCEASVRLPMVPSLENGQLVQLLREVGPNRSARSNLTYVEFTKYKLKRYTSS